MNQWFRLIFFVDPLLIILIDFIIQFRQYDIQIKIEKCVLFSVYLIQCLLLR